MGDELDKELFDCRRDPCWILTSVTSLMEKSMAWFGGGGHGGCGFAAMTARTNVSEDRGAAC